MKVIDMKTNEVVAVENLEKVAEKRQFDNKMVVISNDLARQSTSITLEEEKLLHCIFSQMNPYGKNDTKITLKKSELFEKLGLKSPKKYSETKKRLKNLMYKSMVDIVDPEGMDLYGMVIISARSAEKSEYFEITLNKDFMPYVEQLVSHYTKLQLDSLVQFKSKYSLILYKYLSSWAGTHPERMMIMTTKELKKLFNLSKEDYTVNGEFKRTIFERKTLITAIDEINEKVPGFDVTYTKSKKGNRVQGYIIHWIDRNRFSESEEGVVPGQTSIEDFL